MPDLEEALSELETHQTQLDMDGVMVGVSRQALDILITAARAGLEARKAEESANDIRAQGWSVAVHNDYRLSGVAHTFWLFTKDGRAVKGEGRSDTEALSQVRAAIRALPLTEGGDKP